MSLGYNVTLRNSRLNDITALIDAGVSAGKLRVYNGTRPATGGAVTTLLAELTMSDPSFPAAAAGTMSANAITGDSSADASGTATWFRVVDSAGNHVMDGDVGITGSGADLEFNTVTVAAGVTVNVTAFNVTHGNV